MGFPQGLEPSARCSDGEKEGPTVQSPSVGTRSSLEARAQTMALRSLLWAVKSTAGIRWLLGPFRGI